MDTRGRCAPACCAQAALGTALPARSGSLLPFAPRAAGSVALASATRDAGAPGRLQLAVSLLLALCGARSAWAQVPEHCKNTTLSYDISFVGPRKTIKAGESGPGLGRLGERGVWP